MMQFSPGFRKYFTNTGWLLLERISTAVIALLVSVYVARYLGPSKYGLLSYAISFVGIFSTVATLGLDNIVVRDLVSYEKKRDELLGTAFSLKIIGSIFVLGILVLAIRFTTNDNFTNLLIFIIALATIFQSFNVVDFYFRSRVLSRYAVYARMVSVIVSALIMFLLIYFRTGLIYFAVVKLIESVILAIGLITTYAKQKMSMFDWRIKFDLAKKLLKDSWPLILGGIAVSIYMKIDQVMIKEMINTKAVGNYAVAVKLSEGWYIIAIVIANSVFPAIVNAKKVGEKLYYERLKQLYTLMTWLAIGIALPFTFFANDIIRFLYGVQYHDAAGVLKIYIWAGLFIFLGVAIGRYLIAENYTKVIFARSFIGMIANVLFNIILIPRYGLKGAAIATVVSYFIATFFIGLLPRTKKQAVLMLKSANFFSIFGFLKQQNIKRTRINTD